MIKLILILKTVFHKGYRQVMKNAILLLSALTMSLPTFAAQEQTHQSYLY
ncbi:porin family protein, partial [Vibrio campbellii]